MHLSRSMRLSISVVVILLILGLCIFILITNRSSMDMHATHQKMAQTQNMAAMPSMQGDQNLRYSVNFIKPDTIFPQQDVTLHFFITNASNGNPVIIFKQLYEKPMHMIVVDNELVYFNHIHPTQYKNDFFITTQFPHAGLYRVYLTYQPWGAIEQQVAFIVQVGTILPNDSIQPVDKKLTKIVNNYEVSLDTHGKLQADTMALGQQTITATIKDARTKKPVTNLKPYLGAFGHLTMIHQTDYSSMHIHPAMMMTPKPDQIGGPTVEFLPMSIYGKFKPGIYRVFAEFNPDGKLFTADFTVEVKK